MYTAKRGYRPGDEPISGYHLTKFLGRGQFGEVWQAKGPGGMQVALKIIDLAEREGLKEFAGLQKVKDIRHANLVEFVACWVKTEDGQVLDEVPADPGATLTPRDSSVEIGGTMLFSEGGTPTRPVELIVAMSLGSKTLFRRLQEINHGKEQKVWTGIPDGELLDYMEQAARGIDFLNRQGIIHGDIKPQNLLIVGDSVKVCDFGLAQAVDTLRKTQSGMGTVAYAAPELFEGKPHIQSDQYCLAITYVELHTGFLPFDEPNPYKVIELHRHGKLDLQRLTSRERSVVKRATEIKPERRWPSCFEMVSKLRESRQQERPEKGGRWPWSRGGRSQPTERLPPVEEPTGEEPVESGSGREPAKKGSGGAVPPKRDSAKKKSGPPAPAAARAVQTQRPRGDETDAIAATLPSGNLPEPPPEPSPPPGPSLVGRMAKVAVWICLIGALAFGGYKLASSETGKQWIAALTNWIPGGTKPSKKVLLDYAARGEFDKALGVDTKAKEQLVTVDYEKWLADVRGDWSEPATNPILRRLDPNARDAIEPRIEPREAASLMEAAEGAEGFRKLVDGVPESLWRPIRDKWVKAFEDGLFSGNLNAAILDQAIEELEGTSTKLVPTADRERLRTRIRDGCSRRISDLVDSGSVDQAIKELEGASPKLVPSADRERLRTRIGERCIKQISDLVDNGKLDEAVEAWKTAPLSSANREALRARTQKLWEEKRFDDIIANKKFLDAVTELEGSVAKAVLDPAELAKKRALVALAWKGWFRVLLASAKPDGPADVFEQAIEELKKARTYSIIPEDDYPQSMTQIGDAWCKGVDHLAKSQWVEAKKLLDGAPEDVVPKAEREKKLADIQTAWDKAFDALLKKGDALLKKDDLDAAEQMVASVGPPANLFTQTEIDKRREAVRQKRRQKWLAEVDAAVAKSDWEAAEKMVANPPDGIPPDDLQKKRAVIAAYRRQKWIADFDAAVKAENWPVAVQMVANVPKDIPTDEIAKNLAIVVGHRRQEWDVGFNASIEKKEWEAAKKTLDSATEELLPGQERDQRLARIQTAWDKDFQPLLDKDQLEAADKMVASLPEGLFPQPEIEKKRALIVDRRRRMWVADFDRLVAKPDWAAATKMLDNPPAGYFAAAEIEKKRAQIQASWNDAFKPLSAKGDWEAAKKMLDEAPAHLFGQAELGERLTQIQKPWNTGFDELLAKNDLDSAGKMLDQAARVELFPKQVIEERRATLKDGEYRKWLAAFDKAFSELVDAGKFPEAKKKLDEPAAQERLRPDGIQTRTRNLHKEWIKWIRGNWDKSDQAEKLKVEIDEFLKASPEPAEANEARLLRARALVRLGTQGNAPKDLNDAREDLLALVKARDLPPDRAYVRDVLLAIATKTRRELSKAPDNPVAPWQLNSWEQEELGGIMRPSPPPPPPPGPAIAAVKKALEALHDPQAKPDAARQLLDALEKGYPPASPGSWKVDHEDDLALLTGSVPLGLGKLARDVADGGRAKYADQAKDLGRAKGWLQAAKAKYSVPEIGAALYAVATGRLALRVWEAPKPSQADLQDLQEWDQLPKGQSGAAAAGDELMAKAWRAECNVALEQNIMSARNSLMLIKDALLAKQPAYARYLWCRTLKAAGSGWDDVVLELIELTPALERPDPILEKQGRAGTMAELIVEAAVERRKQFRPWKLDKVPFNPFGDQAEQYAKLLKAARGLVGAGKNPELEVGLVLASFHKAKPETELVWPLTRELLRSPDVDKQADRLPLLFAGVSSFWQQPEAGKLAADDRQFVTAVQATTRLLQELGKDEAGKITNKKDAAAVYESVLKPVLENPDFQAKTEAQKQAGNELLSDLSGAVAKFLENQTEAEWPPWPKSMPSVYHAIEGQATLAIDLAPKDKPNPDKLADYYAMRANALAYKTDWNVDVVLKDVDTALKHKPNLHGAFGVRAYALFMRAGQHSKRDEILQELRDAIKAGEEAVEDCPKDSNTARASYWSNLGLAHLYVGNYEVNAEKKKQHFDKAKELASQAAKLVHEYDHSARFLLGNIYEDLASQVGEDPKQNYLEAKKRFEEVLDKNPLSAQARSSRARCIFKALTISSLNPQDIGLAGDRDAALKKCGDDLEEAIQYAVQDVVRIEAYCYFGQVYEQQGNWAKADENLGKAAELAKQSKASTQAAYVSVWAMLPVSQANRLLATGRPPDDPEILKLLQTAEQRAQELQGIPPGAYTVPVKQAAIILGSVWQKRKRYDEAVNAYNRAVPNLEEADALDVSVLLARADCNLSRPEANRAAFLPAALQDASRALKLAPSPREQAGAHYRVALAHFSLWNGDNAAIQHRDASLESIRKAVELVPKEANSTYVTYRRSSATLIIKLVALSKLDNQQGIPFFKEAEQWLQEARDAAQDPGQRNRIEGELKQVREFIPAQQGQPQAAPAPEPAK